MKQDISIIILTKNEEEMIAECIESVDPIAKEICVIDAQSTDETIKIAQKKGVKVVSKKFKDFATQRNEAIRHTNGNWVCFIDADERMTEKLREEIKYNITENKCDAFSLKRETFYFGKRWGRQDEVIRLFKRDKLISWIGEVHETAKIKGNVCKMKNPLLHYTHRDIAKMVEKTNEWSEIEARLRHATGHPKMSALRFVRVMGTGFFNSYIKDGGWKNGTAGIVEAMYQSFSMFITYAKLWEKQIKKD